MNLQEKYHGLDIKSTSIKLFQYIRYKVIEFYQRKITSNIRNDYQHIHIYVATILRQAVAEFDSLIINSSRKNAAFSASVVYRVLKKKLKVHDKIWHKSRIM